MSRDQTPSMWTKIQQPQASVQEYPCAYHLQAWDLQSVSLLLSQNIQWGCDRKAKVTGQKYIISGALSVQWPMQATLSPRMPSSCLPVFLQKQGGQGWSRIKISVKGNRINVSLNWLVCPWKWHLFPRGCLDFLLLAVCFSTPSDNMLFQKAVPTMN